MSKDDSNISNTLHFGKNNFSDKLNKPNVRKSSNGLMVRALDPQFSGPEFKTTGWLQGRLGRSSFRVRSNEYKEFLRTSGKK